MLQKLFLYFHTVFISILSISIWFVSKTDPYDSANRLNIN